jgi:dihydrofolate synthase/folylpolyglutamate synthase
LVARRLADDRVFFSEWERLRLATRRSVRRAAMFADALGVNLAEPSSIAVVGSKGKATAATFASAAIAAAGLRVGTITSPPIITNRERIRIDGAAIDEASYAAIADAAADALSTLPPATAKSGYLSPAGMYMIAGLWHQKRCGCAVFVVEAAMGGRSDEVSLLRPTIVIVTPIFGEHLGILGTTVAEIAADKLGVVADSTRAIFSTPQTRDVEEAVQRIGIEARIVAAPPIAELSPPPLLNSANACVGIAGGLAYLGAARQPTREDLLKTLATIHLPGRLTAVRDDAARNWLVDAAVSLEGVQIAIRNATERHGPIDLVLISLPDNKDVARTAAWLDETVGTTKWLPVVPPDAQHLPYSDAAWRRSLVAWNDIDVRLRPRMSVVAVGSWSFMSAVLGRLGMDAEHAFTVTCP